MSNLFNNTVCKITSNGTFVYMWCGAEGKNGHIDKLPANLAPGTYKLHWVFDGEVGSSVALEVLVQGQSAAKVDKQTITSGKFRIDDKGRKPPVTFLVP